jgi:flagellar hook-length control protein FliK
VIQNTLDVRATLGAIFNGASVPGLTGESSGAGNSQAPRFDAVLAEVTRTTTQNATKSSTDQGKLKDAFSEVLAQMAQANPAQLNLLAQDPKAKDSMIAAIGSALQLNPNQQAQLSDLTSLALQKLQDQTLSSQSSVQQQNVIQVAQSDEADLAISGDPGPKGRNPEFETSTLQNAPRAMTPQMGSLQMLTVSTRTQVLGDAASPLANEIMKGQQEKVQEQPSASNSAQPGPMVLTQGQSQAQPTAAQILQATAVAAPAQAPVPLSSGQALIQAPQGALATPADDTIVTVAQNAVQKVSDQIGQAQAQEQTALPDDLPVIEFATTMVETSQQALPQEQTRQGADNNKPVIQAQVSEQVKAIPAQQQVLLPVEQAKADGQIQAQAQPAEQAVAQDQVVQIAGQPAQAQAAVGSEQSAESPVKAQASAADNASASPKATESGKMQVGAFKLLRELQSSLKNLDQDPSDNAALAPATGFKQLATDLMKEYALSKTVLDQTAQELDTLKTTSQLKIQLKPEALGNLEVTLVSEGGKLAARIVAATPEVQQALANNLPAYKQALESHGIMVQELSVSVRTDIGQGSQQQPQPQEQSWGTFKPTVSSPEVAVTASQAFIDSLGYTGRLSTLA